MRIVTNKGTSTSTKNPELSIIYTGPDNTYTMHVHIIIYTAWLVGWLPLWPPSTFFGEVEDKIVFRWGDIKTVKAGQRFHFQQRRVILEPTRTTGCITNVQTTGQGCNVPKQPKWSRQDKNVEGLYSPLCIPHLAEGHIQKCEVWIDSFRGAKYKLQPMQICTRGGPLTAAFSGGLWFVNDNLPANGPLCQRHAGKNQLCTAYNRYI